VAEEQKVKSTKDEQPKKFTLKTPKGTKDYTPHGIYLFVFDYP
jgi:hypothetical protein